jgi:hypothetical protein
MEYIQQCKIKFEPPKHKWDIAQCANCQRYRHTNVHVRLRVFTAVTMKNAVFWDVRPVVLVRTDISEERSASIIRVTRISYRDLFVGCFAC